MMHRPDQPEKRVRRLWPVALTMLLVGIVATTGLTAASSLQTGASAPAAQSMAAPLPATTCSYNGGTNTRSCDLWAKTGSLTLPGAVTVPIWGYADTAGGAAQLPGPTLIANQGEILSITLHNTLSQSSSLSFPGQAVVPDVAGAAATTGTKTYTFTAGVPGTQIYEAGLTANGARQVAMGMYGGLIIRPTGAPTRLYPSSPVFTVEALLIFSELDPALNHSADPLTFNMRNYNPKYWLINGQAYPQTTKFGVTGGDVVALRYINAGVYEHSIGSLGLVETILGASGNALNFPHKIVAETLPAGQTLDLQTTVPAANLGTKFALYSGERHLDNAGTSTNKILDTGGMLTFLEVTTGSNPTGDVTGPQTSALTLTPPLSNGTTALSLTATVSDVSTGNNNVAGAGYVIDNIGGTDTAIAGSYGSPSVNLSFNIPTSSLSGLSTGEHTVYVRGKDNVGTGNMGTYALIKFNLDKSGPQTTGNLTRTGFNGTQDLVFQGASDDTANGNSTVTAAEYFIDTAGADGSGTALTGSFASPSVGLDLTIPSAIIGALTNGSHSLKVHSKDALDQWGPVLSLTFTVDHQGPTTTNVAVNPNPNNGTLVVDVNNLGVKVTANLADTLSNIAGAELFIDTVKPDGSGLTLQPTDSGFNSLTENAYTLILLTDGIQNLPAGPHNVYVHGQDAAGNWGTTASSVLVIDKTGPALTAQASTPNPTLGAVSSTLSATATDLVNGAAPASNIMAAEWFEGTDPGKGSGTAMTATDGTFSSPTEAVRATINACTMTNGAHVLSLRAKDLAGNWGPVVTTTLTVSAPAGTTIFGDGFESGNFSAWCSTTGNGLTVTAPAALVGTRGMRVAMPTNNNNSARYVTDNTPNNEAAYNARFYFNPNGVALANANPVDLLNVMNTGGNTVIVRVQWRRSAGSNQIRAVVRANNGIETATNWFTIAASPASHFIEVNWKSSSAAAFAFRLYIDGGAPKQTLTNINTSNLKVDAVRLGILSGTFANSNSGAVFLDAFTSTKGILIGP